MFSGASLPLSGDRFNVVYRLTGDETEAHTKAREICVEQTVEFPADLLPPGDIRDSILGRIESLAATGPDSWEASISYAVETTGVELLQLVNVMFGNSSIKPGIRVERLDLPDSLLRAFKGPRFGREGLRRLLGADRRPLLSTALKPMGLSARDFGEIAYRFALGGLDIVKDDHGLSDQSFAPFRERVQLVVEGVERANRETGGKCIYAPMIAGPADGIVDRALFARQAGATALLVAPGLVGIDTMRVLADDDRIGLPILSHPAFQGSYVMSPDSGVSHYALFGQINRLAGADAAIFPNFGGRFSFTLGECRSIVDAASEAMGHIKPAFALPAGGMSLERVPDMVNTYGCDVILLIGGGLYRGDLVENCRRFRTLVEHTAC